MSLPESPIPCSGSDAAVGEHEDRRRKHPRHAFIARFESHPTRHLADRAFAAELTAHPLYCRASLCSMQRWQFKFSGRHPSQLHAQEWHVYDTDVGLKQRGALLARAALCELLVLRLMRFRGAYGVRHPLHHVTCVVSRRHFLVSKNLADCLFKEGQRSYEQMRFSEASESWGQAALLQHAPSHAFLSSLLIDGRLGVRDDEKQAFELAQIGAAMGCAHSKGVLAFFCTEIEGREDIEKGIALARESAAAGSCFGQYVLGRCCDCGWGVAQDCDEGMRLRRLAAANGSGRAQYDLAMAYKHGFDDGGAASGDAEAARWFRLAAAQGDYMAQRNLAHLLENGRGVAQDYAEAAWWFGLAAAYRDFKGHPNALCCADLQRCTLAAQAAVL
jgi:TPR repeat protein